MDLKVENKIEGFEKLTEIFGSDPSFHDAEVLRIVLDRSGNDFFKPTLEASIYLWQMTNEIDANGNYILRNHCIVNFKFTEIADLSLFDFSYQNVLHELNIEQISDKHYEIYKTEYEKRNQQIKQMLDSNKFYVGFMLSSGFSAEFLCVSITVTSVKRLSQKEVQEISLSGKKKEGV